MNDEEREEALLRRRFDEWTAKGMIAMVPIVIALAGWGFQMQARISEIATLLQERGERFAQAEKQLAAISDIARDPSPKPETKVAFEALGGRIDRLEERLNYIHNYLMALPVRPTPPTMLPSKRGDIRLEDYIRGGMDRGLN